MPRKQKKPWLTRALCFLLGAGVGCLITQLIPDEEPDDCEIAAYTLSQAAAEYPNPPSYRELLVKCEWVRATGQDL